MVARVVALLSFLCVFALSPVGRAAPALRIAGPPSVVGDGTTRATLTVSIDPPGTAINVSQIEVRALGGTLGTARSVGQGRFELSFIPPRVAAARTIAIAVELKHRPLSATWNIEVTPPAIERGERRSKGSFDMTTPERLLLGIDDAVNVSMANDKGRRPQLYASVGSISAPEPGDDGRLHATYRPPTEKHPQLAVIVALSDDRQTVDWTTMMLVARPLVTTKTAPRAAVRWRVAGVDYGPIRADAGGNAEMRVSVPPGVIKGQVLASDWAGNERSGPIELAAPPPARLLPLCPRGGDRFVVVAVGNDGHAREGLELDLTSSHGALAPPTKRIAGVYESVVTLPQDIDPNATVTFAAALHDQTASQVSCRGEVPSVWPIGVKISAEPQAFVAGSETAVRVAVELRYPDGRRPRPVAVAMVAQLGRVGEVNNGAARWELPDNLAGRTSAVIAARVDDANLSARATIALRPAAAARLVATVAPDQLAADGESTARIVVHGFDRFGNPTPSVRLTATANGRVGALDSADNGRHVASYTSPVSYDATSEEVVIRDADGDAEVSVPIALVPMKRRFSLWARGGVLTNFGRVLAPLVIGGGGVRLPILDDGFIAGIEAGYFRSHDSSDDLEISVAAAPILARLAYEFPIELVTPYVGVTGGAFLVQTSVASATGGEIASFVPLAAVAPLGGAEMRFGPSRVGIELGYFYSPIDEGAVAGNAGGFDVTAGYRHDL